MWMMRAGRGGAYVDDFLQQGLAVLGDEKLAKLPAGMTKDDLLKLYAATYPEEKDAARASWASQILRFINEVKIGDDVVTNDRARRRYILGKIKSDSDFLMAPLGGMPYGRKVDWSGEVSREALSASTKNTLGSVLTIFKLNADAAKDLQEHAGPLGAPQPLPFKKATLKGEAKDDEVLGLISAETFERADEFIEDQIDGLDWQQMQELVAGILRAMNYRTTISAPGPDRGVDVFASPDGLGLEEPRIFVEVKHRRNQAIGSKEIRAFVGGRKAGDKCLYVSTGGFSKDASYEAERAAVAITLIDLPKLRKLVVDFYEKLDSETRALVPLRRLYWPAVSVPAG